MLSALRDQINRGSHRWSEVIPLRQAWKSYPSGILQRWPDGTPRTLATDAAEMISISDNTAADALIEIVGANALKPFAAGNNPFLKTREMSSAGTQTRPRTHRCATDADDPHVRHGTQFADRMAFQRSGTLPFDGSRFRSTAHVDQSGSRGSRGVLPTSLTKAGPTLAS